MLKKLSTLLSVFSCNSLMIRNLFVLLILAITVCSSFAQKKITTPTTESVGKVEAYLAAIEKAGYQGSVLVAVKRQKPISKGFGLRNASGQLKNTPDTVFDIGSITKQFTAAAIMKLETQGKLNTDDKLTKYFDNVPTDKAEITLHDLLRHSSGLPSGVGGDYEPISEKEFIDKVLQAPLRFKSGTAFSYSNIGYSLLGMVIEKVSGQSYEQYLYENLWKPAGMETTGYSRPHFNSALISTGYRDDEEWGKPNSKPWEKGAPYWHLKANGGVLSTTGDMYKWHRALLSDKILSKATKEKYHHPKLRDGEDAKRYYGYGWGMITTNRNTVFATHNGTNRVFYSDMYRFIDEDIAIIMLSNKAHSSFRESGREIARIIFEAAYIPNIPAPENKANRDFTSAMIETVLTKGIAEVKQAYAKRQKGVELIERVINGKGYEFIEAKKHKQAVDIFTLNTIAYPHSANAFDSLGEAHMEAGNKALAIENYRKSLSLNPENVNAEEMLERLNKQ